MPEITDEQLKLLEAVEWCLRHAELVEWLRGGVWYVQIIDANEHARTVLRTTLPAAVAKLKEELGE